MLVSTLLVAVSASVLVSAQAPAAAGCTANSFAIPSWFIENLQSLNSNLSTYNSTSGRASFHLTNRATNYTADLTCALGTSGWNACSIKGKAFSNDTLKASIQITTTSAQVLVNQTWTCNDKNTVKL